ncbi:unnamed protein product [Ostreobium quekettii]|uniref:Uncharacterized protein n=1 Tax=Ostreobium quekettii TaxID=121088 RepID=A0A8S1J8D5_9CHLO|nr:unnamed protein product [Ostreobium quekettii]
MRRNRPFGCGGALFRNEAFLVAANTVEGGVEVAGNTSAPYLGSACGGAVQQLRTRWQCSASEDTPMWPSTEKIDLSDRFISLVHLLAVYTDAILLWRPVLVRMRHLCTTLSCHLWQGAAHQGGSKPNGLQICGAL